VNDAELVLRDAETLETTVALSCSAPLASVRWSPDGSLLLGTSRHGTACIWSVEDGACFAQILHDSVTVATARWLPDSNHALMCARAARRVGRTLTRKLLA
jgi:WD40 repeat protein